MHWMLVLFMGVSGSGTIVKTDLVFSDRGSCFKYEEQMAHDNIEFINAAIKGMGEKGASQSEMSQSMSWMDQQFPRGTCIPTVSAVTIGKK
jgi:hypothetical protein